jgi:hypothetical protein
MEILGISYDSYHLKDLSVIQVWLGLAGFGRVSTRVSVGFGDDLYH